MAQFVLQQNWPNVIFFYLVQPFGFFGDSRFLEALSRSCVDWACCPLVQVLLFDLVDFCTFY